MMSAVTLNCDFGPGRAGPSGRFLSLGPDAQRRSLREFFIAATGCDGPGIRTPAGNYTFTVTGTDVVATGKITASTNFTVIIQ